jgi:hypothetical protein
MDKDRDLTLYTRSKPEHGINFRARHPNCLLGWDLCLKNLLKPPKPYAFPIEYASDTSKRLDFAVSGHTSSPQLVTSFYRPTGKGGRYANRI